MIKNTFNLTLGFFMLCAFIATSQEKGKPINVLFVGNSFVYYWNIPQLVNAMADHKGVALNVRQSTVGGSNLKQHWHEERGTITQKLLKEKDWDFVILDDHSLSTINTPERFIKYGKRFSELIRSKGAEPLFYTTWAYKSNPSMQPTITNAYSSLASELNAKTIPVGPIWMKVRRLKPDLNLYFDNKHPSSDGAYLIALIVFKALTKESVLNIPNSVTTVDKNGDKLYLSFILPETGSFLRELVDRIDFKQYNNIKPLDKP